MNTDGDHAARILTDALRELGLTAGRDARVRDSGVDVVVTSTGVALRLDVKAVSLADGARVRRELERRGRQPAESSRIPVLVADRVTEEARSLLREAGWGWLDVRGHVRLVGADVFVEADIPAMTSPTQQRGDPLAGRAGLETACSLLLNPDTAPTVRGLARVLARAPSTVSTVLAGLRADGLIDQRSRPLGTDLFWQVAHRWRSDASDIASLPSPTHRAENGAMRLGLDQVEDGVGWALTDTLAAGSYGARVAARSGYPPDFYVPDEASARRAMHLLGAATSRSARAASIRVAPVAAVCARRVDGTGWANERWPLAHPLFVALDLARDPGRGRELLDDWTPPDPWRRVW